MSGRKPALQGALEVEWKSGAYGELWVSSIKDEGAGHLEADATAGFAFSLSEKTSLDLSATYYLYPKGMSSNALELSAALETTRGPVTATLGASLAPPQRGTLDDTGKMKTNAYLFATVSYEIANSPLNVRASVGREKGPWDMRDGGAKWDCAIGLEARLGEASMSFDYVATNGDANGLVGSLGFRF